MERARNDEIEELVPERQARAVGLGPALVRERHVVAAVEAQTRLANGFSVAKQDDAAKFRHVFPPDFRAAREREADSLNFAWARVAVNARLSLIDFAAQVGGRVDSRGLIALLSIALLGGFTALAWVRAEGDAPELGLPESVALGVGGRELELELTRTGRSRVLWFSLHDGRPYISCGFGCADGWAERWPQHVERDPRVVVRIDGMRVRGRAERVAYG